MAIDLAIEIENVPGALARVAAAISDAGVNIAAATCVGRGEQAELHILVPRAGAAKHALAISHLAVTREREVVVALEDSGQEPETGAVDVHGVGHVEVRTERVDAAVPDVDVERSGESAALVEHLRAAEDERLRGHRRASA